MMSRDSSIGNQESSEDKEIECDSMMLKTFYHIYIYTFGL